jgi:hypothetical protein
MPARSVLPLIALAVGAFVLTSGKKAEAKAKVPPPGEPPLGEPIAPQVGPLQPGELPPSAPHSREIAALYTVRQDDLPIGVSKYYTGDPLRFKEMTYVSGPPIDLPAGDWFPGSVVRLPGSWQPFSKPLPGTGGKNPQPGPADQFPEAAA